MRHRAWTLGAGATTSAVGLGAEADAGLSDWPTPAARRRAVPLLLAALVTSSAGCRYRTEPIEAPNFAGVREGCLTCAETGCLEQWDACLADTACRRALECYGACTEPDCSLRCRAESDFNRDALGVLRCMFADACENECSENWECTGHYEWARPESPEPVQLTLHYRTQVAGRDDPLVGVRVERCRDHACEPCTGRGCAALPAFSETDYNGWVNLQLPVNGRHGFTGHLRVSGGGVRPTARYLGHPVARREEWYLVVEHRTVTDLSISLPSDPDRGSLHIGALDCLMVPARGVRFTVDTADATTETWYDDRGRASEMATETDASGRGGFVGLPVGPVQISAWREDTQVARLEAFVHSKRLTSVQIFPFSGADARSTGGGSQ